MGAASPRIVIVGAGVSGLAVAYRLRENLQGADITIVEHASRPGGTAWTLREAGFQVEIGPNGFLGAKDSTLNLARQLGLGDQLVQATDAARENRYLFLGDRLRPLPTGFFSFLCSGLLSLRGKFSLLWERFRASRTEAGDETIDAFARRRGGDEAADVFADALVTGIYAGDPKLLSLPACFPRLAELEREYGSIIKGFLAEAKKRKAEAAAKGEPYERSDKMWSFTGGMRTLVETLSARLAQPPIFGVPIRGLSKIGDPARPTWRVHADGHDGWDADAVVLTCPAHQQANIIAGLDGGLAESIAGIPYNRVVVVALGFRKTDLPAPLDGFGYIAPQNTRRDLLGVQWCSSIYPGRAPDDCVLVRAMCGGWHRPEIVDWDDERLLASIRAELRLAMGFEAAPVFHKIIRWDKAIPQYHLGHLDRVAGIDAKLATHPGLYLGGNAYRGVALNDCTEQGELLAKQIADFV
ncbi:MAG: protoporphyrinogen oxidase [Planctomycetes bacterium]|nr:protoporphyrinogen oxidase [Planctomycetota bacterium]